MQHLKASAKTAAIF